MDFQRTERHNLQPPLQLTFIRICFLAFSELAKINVKGHTFKTQALQSSLQLQIRLRRQTSLNLLFVYYICRHTLNHHLRIIFIHYSKTSDIIRNNFAFLLQGPQNRSAL